MGDVPSTIMIWSFVAGLVVAFAGAFIAHLFVSYRQTSEQFQGLVAVLSQIAELNQDELEDAARAAQEASKNDNLNTEIDHVGAYVWRLQKRLHETLEPVYPHVGGDIKDDIHQIDKWIYMLNDGVVGSNMVHTWVTGGAGDALNKIPTTNFLRYVLHYFIPSRRNYRTSLEVKNEKQAKLRRDLAKRRENISEIQEKSEFNSEDT